MKTIQKNIRFEEQDYKLICEEAEKCHITTSSYIRAAVLDKIKNV